MAQTSQRAPGVEQGYLKGSKLKNGLHKPENGERPQFGVTKIISGGQTAGDKARDTSSERYISFTKGINYPAPLTNKPFIIA